MLAQGCNELFFSEYVEGWSNNKALEIYNPTDDAVDLSNYRLERYSNGNTSASEVQKIDLYGTLAADDVIVVVIEKLDPDGSGNEAPVWEELQYVTDLFLCPVYDDNNTMYFNGNDAMVLRKIDSDEVVDVFGKIGEDPGNPFDGGGWNDVGPDYTWSINGETSWTANHTLIRKEAVDAGDINPIDPFDVSIQWDSLAANTFTNLGMHTSICNGTNVEEIDFVELSLYPNPSTTGLFTLDYAKNIKSLEVFGSNAAEALIERTNVSGSVQIDLTEHPAGIYILRTLNDDGSYGWARLINQ